MSSFGIFYHIISLVLTTTECHFGDIMYKNRNKDGTLNICGRNIRQLRKAVNPVMSQRALADRLQLAGMDLDKNAIQRIEAGQRFVTDIELSAFAKVFNTTTDELLK